MAKNTKNKTNNLTPRQNNFLRAYTSPDSKSFGNSYQSAVVSGYTASTAKNITHLNPDWLSESIGTIASIQPDEIMGVLTAIIHNTDEPSIIRLKALELSMKAHSMLSQRTSSQPQSVHLSIDLTSSDTPT